MLSLMASITASAIAIAIIVGVEAPVGVWELDTVDPFRAPFAALAAEALEDINEGDIGSRFGACFTNDFVRGICGGNNGVNLSGR